MNQDRVGTDAQDEWLAEPESEFANTPQEEKHRWGRWVLALTATGVFLLAGIAVYLLNNEVDASGEEITALEEDREELGAARDRLRDDLNSARAAIEGLEGERNAGASELATVREELSEATSVVVEAEDAAAALEIREAEVLASEESLERLATELGVVIEAESRESEAAAEGGPVGSTISFDSWDITLEEVEVQSTLEDSSPRGQYLVLLLAITNNAQVQRDFLGSFDTSFNFLDVATEREYVFDSSASLDYHQTFRTDAWHLDDIGPGLTAKVPIVFDVPLDVTAGLAAMVKDGDVSPTFYVEL